MDFRISADCRRLGLRAAALVFRDLHIGAADASLRSAIAAVAQAVRGRFANVDAIRAAPEVVAFQELLRKVGVNPRRLQPSVERLLSSAIKRGVLPAINSLVDAYNLVSVRTLCSMGAHDLNKITSPVSLQLLTGDESFVPLGRNEPEVLAAGEYGYVDGAGRVLCRLDVVQADFSKVTTDTTAALLIVEGTVAHPAERLRRACDEAIELITRHCGGAAEIVALPE